MHAQAALAPLVGDPGVIVLFHKLPDTFHCNMHGDFSSTIEYANTVFQLTQRWSRAKIILVGTFADAFIDHRVDVEYDGRYFKQCPAVRTFNSYRPRKCSREIVPVGCDLSTLPPEFINCVNGTVIDCAFRGQFPGMCF